MRIFSTHNGVNFVLTYLDVPGLFLFLFYLFMPGGALFHLAVRESLTNLNSGISLVVNIFLFKFK